LIFEELIDPPLFYTDDKRLSQILRNFISNALKFTPRGEVRVSAKRVGNEKMAFSVTDTGIGIAQEHLGSIFEDFVQVDSPIQKRWHGTGLGLSLSRRIAELLGGSVSVESQPNVGSTFSVLIPVYFDPSTGSIEAPKENLDEGVRQVTKVRDDA
jgi:signal transduction histidine kinase